MTMKKFTVTVTIEETYEVWAEDTEQACGEVSQGDAKAVHSEIIDMGAEETK